MLNIIAAIAKNNCIGKDGTLPWHLPEDLKHFKKLTTGKTVVMGKKTWESLPDNFSPLPNRLNIVLSRSPYEVPDEVLYYNSLEKALAKHKEDDLFIIGGGQIYQQTINKADKLYITHVDQDVDGDTFFPDIDPDIWQETKREEHNGFAFVTYKRK